MKHSEIEWSKLISFGLALVGKPYKFGAEIDIKKIAADPNPNSIIAIDCSELIEVLFALVGLSVPDGSYNQAKFCRHVSKDNLLIGDLAFKWWPDTEVIHHVGINIGEGRILEAKGRDFGVIVTPIEKYTNSSHFAFFGRHPKILDA